ncbi:MAG: hypothetical protein P1U42_06855 [Phycisphaerales bacterium]|nr:hypothetical protein [Phycisphaerales bacterium]
MARSDWKNVKYIGGIPTFPKKKKYTIRVGQNLLQFCKGRRAKFQIPITNVSNIRVLSYLELNRPDMKSKSVVGRAVVGGLLLGPVGAVVGGISGVGQKQQLTLSQNVNKNEFVVLITADELGIIYNFGLIVPAIFLKRNAAERLMNHIQTARIYNARATQQNQ